MKALDAFITVLALTCFASLPLTAQAEEDLDGLDVTMEVLDDETGLDDDIADMAGRDDPDDDREGVEAGSVAVEEHYGDHRDDEFESIDEIDDDERDHEEGEDVEEDVFEDEPVEEPTVG